MQVGEGQRGGDDRLDEHGVDTGQIGAHEAASFPGSGMGGVGTWREAVTPTEWGAGRQSVTGRGLASEAGSDGRSRNGGPEGLERGQVGHQVRGSRQIAAASPRDRYGVRMRDQPPEVSPATARPGRSGAMAQAAADRFGGDVAERHLGGGFVVDAVADAAGQLGTEHGRALAQFGAEALAADLQVDAGGAAELGEPDELGDHLVAPLLLLPGGDEEEFGDLVHEQHDGHGPFAARAGPRCRR